MRLSRLYTEQPLLPGAIIELDGDQAHYLGKVLRAKPGQQFALFNANSGEYIAEVMGVSKRSVQLQLADAQERVAETLLPTHIGLGLSRGERMDYAIQKATELGVSVLSPLFTEHSEVKLSHERADKRVAHWHKVAISAAEQCGRCTVPVINNPLSISDWLAQVPPGQGFLLDHTGEAGFTGACPEQIHLLIGPEGGISPEEKSAALRQGFTPVRLGPRILRTETAPVVALTAIQLQWGDL
ncbi:MAG: 16S rRNA (uracil(1498)-N(3))-methyltransferase [Pseudohongiella sp.]|uniref:16S rRNA (uracil(1498)-N(3))-methyltransferase n=1 Tax=Pseudohongiella sp. TaxID=1979412 RepID=UPI00349FFB42